MVASLVRFEVIAEMLYIVVRDADGLERTFKLAATPKA